MQKSKSTYTEEVMFNREDNFDSIHIISMHSGFDMFIVHCSYDPSWEYIFCSKDTSKFKQVRLYIMDAIDKHDEVEEMLDYLDHTFKYQFRDLLVS